MSGLLLGTIALPLIALAQAPTGDIFSSSSNEAAGCGTAMAACTAKHHLERAADSRGKRAGMLCRGKLDTAVAHEDALNGQLEHLKTLVGRAHDDYYKSTVSPTNQQRVRALDDYRQCVSETAPTLPLDPRPPDYPRSSVLLRSGTATNVSAKLLAEPPAGPPSLAGALRAMNDALDPAAEPLKNLSNVLDAIAPHYDIVSSNDVGLRVIKDILVDMGVGHLGSKIGPALKAMATKAGQAAIGAAKKAGRAAARRASAVAGGANRYSGLGPGATIPSSGANPKNIPIPEILQKTPRPMHLQEEEASCVQACTRMVTDTIKRENIPESALRTRTGDFYTPGDGTDGHAIATLLTDVGVPNSGWGVTNVGKLAQAVRDGYPAIISYGNKHVSVLDAVVEHDGAKYYFIRNPTNLGLVSDPQTLELLRNSGFSNYAVVAERDFLDSYVAGGAKAVLTSPSVLH